MGNSLRPCLWKLNYSETDLTYFTVLEHCHVNPYHFISYIHEILVFCGEQTFFCEMKMEKFVMGRIHTILIDIDINIIFLYFVFLFEHLSCQICTLNNDKNAYVSLNIFISWIRGKTTQDSAWVNDILYYKLNVTFI